MEDTNNPKTMGPNNGTISRVNEPYCRQYPPTP